MKFEIRQIPVQVFLGVDESERAQKQKVLVSLSFSLDTSAAEISDNLTDSVDYFQIYSLVKNFAGEKSFHLLEHLHAQLRGEISRQFKVENLHLQIEKFPFADASVKVSGE